MGAKNHNTARAKQQERLDDLRAQITSWYIDERLTSLDIQEKLKAIGLDLTVGQVHYSFHRFGLKRDRNTMTAKHLESLQNRVHPRKWCKHCKEEYEPKSGNQIHCSECVVSKSDIRRIKNYGIGHREFMRMLAEQNERCEICKKHIGENETAVDHDHVTGKVRGLLCRPCNLKLPVIEDKCYTVSAQTYLVKYGSGL